MPGISLLGWCRALVLTLVVVSVAMAYVVGWLSYKGNDFQGVTELCVWCAQVSLHLYAKHLTQNCKDIQQLISCFVHRLVKHEPAMNHGNSCHSRLSEAEAWYTWSKVRLQGLIWNWPQASILNFHIEVDCSNCWYNNKNNTNTNVVQF